MYGLELQISQNKSSIISLLKWYYPEFHLQMLGCNCYVFQETFNDKRQINDNVNFKEKKDKIYKYIFISRWSNAYISFNLFSL